MRRPPVPVPSRSQRGASLIELLIAVIVMSIGILALAQLFPAGSGSQAKDRMMSSASYYTQNKIEELNTLPFADAALTAGRHPAGTATEALGTSGKWRRFYNVTDMTGTISNLKLVTVTVSWTSVRACSVSASTYVRR
jgi:Tfp pilus assembly protein PilV